MGEAEVEGDVGDGGIGRSLRQAGVQLGEAHIEQHLRDRQAEVTAEAELQRADADAGRAGELRQIERLAGIVGQMVARRAERARQPLSRPENVWIASDRP